MSDSKKTSTAVETPAEKRVITRRRLTPAEKVAQLQAELAAAQARLAAEEAVANQRAIETIISFMEGLGKRVAPKWIADAYEKFLDDLEQEAVAAIAEQRRLALDKGVEL